MASSGSPARSPRPVDLVLRAVVFLQIVGFLAAARVGESTTIEILYIGLGLPEGLAASVAWGVAGLLAAAALGALVTPRHWYLYPVAAWFFGVAVAEAWLGGSPHAYLTPVADTARWMAPVALAHVGVPDGEFDLAAEHMLRYSASATFAIHGWEALLHNPEFLDFLFGAGRRIGIPLAEGLARSILTGVGILDLAVAAVLAGGGRWLTIAGWMAFWAAVAAGARTVHLGAVGIPATLVRTANAGVPLALVVGWWCHESSEETPRE